MSADLPLRFRRLPLEDGFCLGVPMEFGRPGSSVLKRAGERVSKNGRGFTLLELLTVIAIVTILAAVAVPATSSIAGGQSLTYNAGTISGILEQARSYSMANHTYVYVGFFEADGGASAAVRPQNAGVGRVYVGVAASRDGTNGYASGIWDQSDLIGIMPLKHFDGMHLVGQSIAATLPNMDQSAGNDLDFSNAAQTTFNGPVGASSGQSVCTFSNVIQFNPDGAATIVTNTSSSSIPATPFYIQIGLQSAHGNRAAGIINCAGIQIDGVTGVVRTFRP